jgi:hypothetical protein
MAHTEEFTSQISQTATGEGALSKTHTYRFSRLEDG